MTTIHLFDARTGNHSFNEGQVWDKYDGPSYLGTYMNRGGVAVAVTRPRAGLRWNGSPIVTQAFQIGALDASNPDVSRNVWLVALISRLDARIGLRIDALEEQARSAKQAKAAQIVSRGSWLVVTSVGGWTHETVHATRQEALKAARRPSERCEIWQGDFAVHRGGWVSAKGRRFLRDRWEDEAS